MKRFLDLLISITLIIVLSPVIIVVSLLILIDLGSPILLRQERPGKGEIIFTLYKFRTMTNEKDKTGKLMSDEKRLTKLGIRLRKYSLDELPQLFNVLIGDMSLIGPRPLLIRYIPYYTEKERQRHAVKPGITGLAQISGRNSLSWDKRLELDVKYVHERTLLLDFYILYNTLVKVIKKEDIVVAPDTVMLDLDAERRNSGVGFL